MQSSTPVSTPRCVELSIMSFHVIYSTRYGWRWATRLATASRRSRPERSCSIPPPRRRRASAAATLPESSPPDTSGPAASLPGPAAQAVQPFKSPEMAWRRIDLHIHTPASSDYQQSGVTILDILRRAADRELDIIAFTDHNSVRGYADFWREIEDLEMLEY